MRRSDAKAALEAARSWDQRGLLQPGALDTIENELSEDAAEGKPSLAVQAFYGVGGIMLGAATAALFALLRVNEVISFEENTAWTFFILAALPLLAAGIGLVLRGQPDLGDALLLSGMVPMAITLGPQPPSDLLWTLPILGALALLAWRRDRVVVPLAALAVALVATPSVLFRAIQSEDAAAFYWLLLALGALAGMLVWNRAEEPRWGDPGVFATTVSVAAASLTVVFEVIEPQFDAGVEVLFGIALLALIGVGVLLKEVPMLFAAGGALTIDAIVFAFDIGGPTTGLVTLLLLSAGLIAGGTLLRRRAKAQPS